MKLKNVIFGMIGLFLLFAFSSCDIDPHEGERPLDYEGSAWMCQKGEYVFYYSVEDVDQSYYTKNGGEKQKISFLWSGLSNGVTVYEYVDGEKAVLLTGECEFHEEWFLIHPDYDTSPKELLREIRFVRVSEGEEL